MNRALLSILSLALLAACSGERGARDTAQSTGALGATAGDTTRRDTAQQLTPTGNVANRNPNKDAPPPGGPPTSNSPQHNAPGASGPTQPGAPTTSPTTSTSPGGTPPTAQGLAPAGTATAAVAANPPPEATRPTATHRAPRPPLPFSPGERLVYDVKFGAIDVGDAVMEVLGVEAVRGEHAFHVRFNVKGGTFLYKVNDRYESWLDTTSLVSLRHWQSIDEGKYERERKYEIVPGGTFRENDKPEQPTVAQPLDDGSFFFFLRTIPLEVGQTYSFNRYFRPDRNPVTVTVARKERIKVPAGTFDAFVLHPTIKAKGVFGEGGQAEIWLADDSTRQMLQMKSKLKFGSLNLYLKKVTRGS